MVELHKRADWYTHCVEDDEDRIEQLFFAKVSSQKILKYNHEVLLIDATYKTNKYKMPLIIISGVTPLNTSYYVAFAFVSKETFEVYKWLLECVKDLYEYLDIPDPDVILTDAQNSLIQAITIVYPLASHLLCLWHINKNVVVHCKKCFDNETWEEFLGIWHEVLYAPTEEVFQENWLAMRAKYGEHLGFPVDYLEDKIIRPHSQKVIRCYTNQVQHFVEK